MGVIEKYLVSTSNPSIVGGTGTTIKYFSSNPPQSLWNSGVAGVNSPITATQLGATPSSTSANGQLSFDSVAYKLQGGRFRMYASGSAVATGTPTVTATVQINTGTIASPSYATFLNGVASNAVVTTVPIAWSCFADLFYDPTSATLSGFQSYTYANATGGGTDKTQIPVALTTVASVTAGGLYSTQFGFVVGITFSVSNAANSASLYEFKIVQD
jgi:hypothetical protein